MIVSTFLTINGDRLISKIEQLAQIGKQADGSICRLAFTPDDQQARQQVQDWMEAAGMQVRVDAGGNLIGRYAGEHDELPVFATGSHIDTVSSGGSYDGVLGVLAGIEVVQILQEQQWRLRHPLEVIVFADEESTMIGSRVMAGQPTGLKATDTLITELAAIGGDWHHLPTATRSRADMAAFLELHVEQGGVLESQRATIGVVQGVVGMQRYTISITGQANHAGTTPMTMRQDALVAAAQIVLFVQELALSMPGEPVATVGYLNVAPNAVNIVPGQVTLSVDIRDLSQTCLETMADRLEKQLIAIARSTHTEITLTPILCSQPTLAAPLIQTVIQQVCEQFDLSYHHLPSRAGHDAMELGRITDMGMIFVPSQLGISHSGEEYTAPDQCIQGANVLLNALLQLDSLYA